MKKPSINLSAKAIDEQIEEILTTVSYPQGSAEEQCVRDLHYLYNKEQLLSNARQRLMPGSLVMNSAWSSPFPHTIQPENNTLVSRSHQGPRRKIPLWKSAVAFLAAAILLASLLIGVTSLIHTNPQARSQQSHPGQNIKATATPSPAATILLSDPLSSNINNWSVASNKFFFRNGAYHIVNQSNDFAAVTLPERTFAPPWSYSLTMTQIKGDTTSPNNTINLLFGYTMTNQGGHTITRFYALSIVNEKVPQDEYRFALFQYDSNRDDPWSKPLFQSRSQAFHTGLNTSNTIEITATAHSLTFTANNQVIGTIHNVTVNRGGIG
ncbi:MAG TPA: hypothetical protein VFN35_19755, partial [Ktedonobacteraceae bacterium]|nr:hypothetical protein [Ktedonobacteraceae bacterium]